ncbi:unnamed protein product [Ascophyllum nodosum]
MAATRGPRTFAKASQHLEIGRQPLLPDEPDKSFRLNDREDAGEADLLPLTSRSNDISVEDTPSLVTQALAAAFYAGASLTVIFVNKLVLTAMEFPSFFFIAISQFTSTCFVISVLRITRKIKIAKFDRETARAVAPLMIMFVCNTVSGLGGTKHISLPMFTVLRRFSILMTMVMERVVLKTVVTSTVQLSVALMIGGALVAALFDLKFDLMGYLLILANDFFTAAYGVSIKRALNLSISQTSLLYFNSLFGATMMTMVLLRMPDETRKIVEFDGWRNPTFIALYICTSFMAGSVLQYSIVVCTRVNSALTTSVIGCVKNLLPTVVGMLGVGGDYDFGALNGAGLAVSMGGSFLYSWAKATKR